MLQGRIRPKKAAFIEARFAKRCGIVKKRPIGRCRPNELLGTLHDRAPMALLPSQYADWLDGEDAALSLVGVHPDAVAFVVEVL